MGVRFEDSGEFVGVNYEHGALVHVFVGLLVVYGCGFLRKAREIGEVQFEGSGTLHNLDE